MYKKNIQCNTNGKFTKAFVKAYEKSLKLICPSPAQVDRSLFTNQIRKFESSGE